MTYQIEHDTTIHSNTHVLYLPPPPLYIILYPAGLLARPLCSALCCCECRGEVVLALAWRLDRCYCCVPGCVCCLTSSFLARKYTVTGIMSTIHTSGRAFFLFIVHVLNWFSRKSLYCCVVVLGGGARCAGKLCRQCVNETHAHNTQHTAHIMQFYLNPVVFVDMHACKLWSTCHVAMSYMCGSCRASYSSECYPCHATTA